MKKKDIVVLALLILLTIVTGLVSENYQNFKMINTVIMVLSGLKFVLVAFQFMELKKANVFWKVLLMSFLTLFVILVLIIT